MRKRALREISVITLSVLVAFGLSLLPLPSVVLPILPDWVLLVVLYWAIYLPHRVGLSVAWLTGLLTDALTNSLLGEHAMASAITLYFAAKFYRRIRAFSPLQQFICVTLLVTLYRGLLFWLQGVIQQPLNLHYGLTIATSALLWSLIRELLADLQRRWQIE